MELFIVLFFISAPIFWLYGIISFLRNFTKKDSSPSSNSLGLIQEILFDLGKLREKETTITNLITKYQQRLTAVNEIAEPLTPIVTSEIAVPQKEVVGIKPTSTVKETLNVDVNDWWDKWYQENSINLLLYIGAFLIVSSAAIFVGFNWESFTGTFKAMILSLITIAFFGAGFFFYHETPKLRNAGSTFLAIGSLLIPFNGLAWYNFALRDTDIGFGGVWLITSLIAVTVYFLLAYFVQNRFYTYIAGLGGLSLVEALVNIGNLDSQFYILGGIFSAFVLLGGSKFIASTKKENFEEIYSTPLSVSSNIVMPIFLTWGLSVAYSSQRLFTPEVTVSAFLASCYYFLSYLISKNISIFTLAQLLTSLTVVLAAKTMGYSGAPIFYLILFTALVFQGFSYYLKTSNKNEESYYSTFISIFISLLALGISFVDPLVEPTHRLYFTLIVSVLALNASFLERIPTYLYIALGAVNTAAFVYVWYVLERPEWFSYLGLFYFVLGALLFILGNFYWTKRQTWAEVLVNFSTFNLFLGTIFSFADIKYLFIGSLLILAISAFSQYYFKSTKGFYSSVVAVALSLVAWLISFVSPEQLIYTRQVYYGLIVATMSALATYLERKSTFLYVTIFSLDFTINMYVIEVLGKITWVNYLGIFYLIFGIALYLCGQNFWKQNKSFGQTLLISSAVNLILALIYTASYPMESLVTSLGVCLVLATASYFLERDEPAYLSVAFLLLSTFNVLRVFDAPIEIYPFAFSATGYLVYFTSLVQLPSRYKEVLRNSGLATALAVPVLFGSYALNSGLSPEKTLEFNSLITAYLATALLIFDALNTKKSGTGYFASAVGLITILWQYKYLNITEVQIYSGTIGLYFLGLAYTKHLQNKKEDQQLFDAIGLGSLLIPLSLQAFPMDGYWYALALGLEGVILLLAGLGLNYKTYTYAGAAAIALATLTRIYSYVASLPSWAVIGLGGLLFLSVAIYLLQRRSD